MGSNPINFRDPSGLVAALNRGVSDKQATRLAGKAGLDISTRLNCLFSIASPALELAGDRRIDIVEIREDCLVKTKARKGTKGKSSDPRSVSNPSKQNHVYIIFAKNRTGISKVGISTGPLNRKSGRGPSQLKSGEGIFYLATKLTRSQALALECTVTWALVLAGQNLPGDKSACKKKAKAGG